MPEKLKELYDNTSIQNFQNAFNLIARKGTPIYVFNMGSFKIYTTMGWFRLPEMVDSLNANFAEVIDCWFSDDEKFRDLAVINIKNIVAHYQLGGTQ
jgi:3-polyprenyl-4-hydroxybenzoate decarboxylase